MGLMSGNSETMSTVSEPGIAVCADWATDMMLAPEERPLADAIAAKGIEDATVRRLRLSGVTIGTVACRVAGCKVSCRILSFRNPETHQLVTTVESEGDATGFDHCPRRPLDEAV